MELRNFMTLKAILETGSFQNAADKLGYTQSTITFQIRQLEQELSVKLFEKIGRKMFLTQAGKDILPYIDSIIQTMHALNDYSKNGVVSVKELKIAMPESLLIYKMMPVIKEFRKRFADIKLSILSLNCYAIKQSIINGEIDFGVHYDIGKYNSNIHFEDICQVPLSVVSSHENLEAAEKALAQKDTSDLYLILNSHPKNIYRTIALDYFNDNGMYFKNIVEFGSTEAIKKSVINNLGISLLPTFAVEEELENHLLWECKTELANQKLSVMWAKHKNKWQNPAMECFLELAIEQLVGRHQPPIADKTFSGEKGVL